MMYWRIMNVPVAVPAGGMIIPIKLLTHPRAFKTRNTGTIRTCSGTRRTLMINKKINCRPKNRYLARANPAMELTMTVITLLVAATITEFIAYLGTSPVAKTAAKYTRLKLRRSKLGGKVNNLPGGWNAEKMAQRTGTRKMKQTPSAQQSYATCPTSVRIRLLTFI
jgi:hypothetical protein